jgi:hypothetical protein
MKTLSPQELLTVVAKQSTGVSVRLGQTNGQAVLHLVKRKLGKQGSRTIPATLVAWNLHEWNESTSYPTPKEESA